MYHVTARVRESAVMGRGQRSVLRDTDGYLCHGAGQGKILPPCRPLWLSLAFHGTLTTKVRATAAQPVIFL